MRNTTSWSALAWFTVSVFLQAAGCLTGGGVGVVPQALILSYMTMSVAVHRFMSKHSVVGKVSRAT